MASCLSFLQVSFTTFGESFHVFIEFSKIHVINSIENLLILKRHRLAKSGKCTMIEMRCGIGLWGWWPCTTLKLLKIHIVCWQIEVTNFIGFRLTLEIWWTFVEFSDLIIKFLSWSFNSLVITQVVNSKSKTNKILEFINFWTLVTSEHFEVNRKHKMIEIIGIV